MLKDIVRSILLEGPQYDQQLRDLLERSPSHLKEISEIYPAEWLGWLSARFGKFPRAHKETHTLDYALSIIRELSERIGRLYDVPEGPELRAVLSKIPPPKRRWPIDPAPPGWQLADDVSVDEMCGILDALKDEHDIYLTRRRTGLTQREVGGYNLGAGLRNASMSKSAGQDAVRAWSDSSRMIMVVADGVGSSYAGEIIAESLTMLFVNEIRKSAWNPFPSIAAIRSAMESARVKADKQVEAALKMQAQRGVDVPPDRVKVGSGVNFVSAFIRLDVEKYVLYSVSWRKNDIKAHEVDDSEGTTELNSVSGGQLQSKSKDSAFDNMTPPRPLPQTLVLSSDGTFPNWHEIVHSEGDLEAAWKKMTEKEVIDDDASFISLKRRKASPAGATASVPASSSNLHLMLTHLPAFQRDMVLGIREILVQVDDDDNRCRIVKNQVRKFHAEGIHFDYREFGFACGC
jgi:hypothetical protein